jgi:hypothetical protein
MVYMGYIGMCIYDIWVIYVPVGGDGEQEVEFVELHISMGVYVCLEGEIGQEAEFIPAAEV